MAERDHHNDVPDEHEDDAMLDQDEAEEVLENDEDAAMDSGDDQEDDTMDETQEISLQNDSAAHFDHHSSSIFSIAQHPLQPELIVTGGGDDIAHIWDSTPPPGPVLPTSYETTPQPRERASQTLIASLSPQDESVNAATFTNPSGTYILTATLAGTLSAYTTPTPTSPKPTLIATAKEVDEINWLLPNPSGTKHPNTVALGASDGSVWIYTVSSTSGLEIVQSFFLHQASCTAGAWTPDGKMLATVAEDGSLYAWDVFGEAAAAGVGSQGGSQAVVALTGDDERFRVEGGLYSVAISPGGGIVAVGGAEGQIRVVGLPRLSAPGAKGKTGGGVAAAAAAAGTQVGQILASLQAQSDGVETLDFSQPPLTLLAAGSVDGSIVLFDAAHNFAVRRHIKEAHEEEAVIKVEFVKTPLGTPNERGWTLTSCGNDGVIRRWDVRGGSSATAKGLIGEWRGHRGGGEGGGILGFVQGGGGSRVVTAGDDGVALVFDMS